MKKVLLVLWVLMFMSIAFGQEIKKGTLVGVHIFSDVKLAPGVTMEQFVGAYNKLIPVWEKALGNWKFYPIKRLRGDKAPTYGIMIVVPSEKERNKYYNADGSDSDLRKAVTKSTEQADKELAKLGTIPRDSYIDWLVY